MFGAKNLKREYSSELYKRLIVFVIAICCLFAFIGIRLVSLQIIQSEKYAMLSNKNQVRIISQPARRGNIYDSKGVVLANSKTVFAIAISTSEINKNDKKIVATNLAAILNDPEITSQTIIDAIDNQARKYEPIIIKLVPYEENLELISTIEEHREDLPGVMVIEQPQRNYPLQFTAGHILGQVGLISDNEQDLIDKYNYLSTDWIGKSGLEKSMERFTNTDGEEIGLRGKRGVQTLEVDSKHRTVRTISQEDAIPGNSLKLTLDSKVQQVMEQSLTDTIAKISKTRPKCKAGAAVMVDIKTGGIIAMASSPGMDPNDFSKGLTTEKARYYWNEQTKPLYNRAISAAYPPGSTFKPSTAMAVMADGSVPANFTVNCGPAMWQPPRAKCPSAHGTVDLKRAMAVSCNAYFQETAYRVGIDNLYDVFKKLGYGQLSGIELPGEVKGLLANKEWKAETFKNDDWEREWRPYDTFYMSMGQGYSNNTPIQMANAIATIANDGVRMQSFLVDQITDYQDKEIYKMEPKSVATIEISNKNLKAVQESMRAVCTKGGTGYGLFGNSPYAVAAKTGTAQTGLEGDDKNKDYHGWFVAYAPYDDPQVAFAGVIEYGYHGSTSAGYVCKAVFDQYFGLNDAVEAGKTTNFGLLTGPIE